MGPNQYDLVKVVKLLTNDRRYDGTNGIKRPPQVGDIGTVVENYGSIYIVECNDSNGLTIWLADFTQEEVEQIQN